MSGAIRRRLGRWGLRLICAAAPAVLGCATGSTGTGGGLASSSAHGGAGAAGTGGSGGIGGAGGHGGTGGQGGCQTDADCPTPSSACVAVTCEGGACKTADTPKGTACSTPAGGILCNGAGTCVACLHPTDCPQGEECSTTNTCVPPSCTDGVLDGAESDVDCGGGTCPPCGDGRMCLLDADCASKACDVASFTCTGDTCNDHVKDGAETDVDCGGTQCGACALGKMCAIDADCASNACNAVLLTCINPLCNDGMKDGTETDLDCGGACSPCAAGRACAVDQDCVSKGCDAQTHLCDANQCGDHRKDGVETDVDCGGGICTVCAVGQLCQVGSDCVSHSCQSNTCAPNFIVPCANGMKDVLETDVDCGGSQCPVCALGKGCLADTDCASNACDATALACVASQCADHRRDGLETDVDCGGGVCPGCAAGQRCAVDADCAAGHTCAGSPPVCM